MNKLAQNTQGAKDAPKVEIEIKTPASADVEIKSEIKPAPKSKTSQGKKQDAPKAESKPIAKVEPEKVDLAKVAPLTIDKKVFDEKIESLNKKLMKEKSEFTTRPFHLAFGHFLVKRKSGLMVIEYHPSLKKSKWLLRDAKGKVLTPEPFETMWKLNEFVNANY